MAWPANNYIATDKLSHTIINGISSALQTWGGNVNGGGYNLSNVGVVRVGATGMSYGKLRVGDTDLQYIYSVANPANARIFGISDGTDATPVNSITPSGLFQRVTTYPGIVTAYAFDGKINVATGSCITLNSVITGIGLSGMGTGSGGTGSRTTAWVETVTGVSDSVGPAFYAGWDSAWKNAATQYVRVVGREIDMNNLSANAGADSAKMDATFGLAIYSSSNNLGYNNTVGFYLDSGDTSNHGRWYFPLKFGANAVVTGYPHIDTSTVPNTRATDFAWIGNNQAMRWADSAAANWPLLFLSSTDNFYVSAPTGKAIYIGPNLSGIIAVTDKVAISLTTYASDAAAGSAGLTAGMLYKHSDGSVHTKL